MQESQVLISRVLGLWEREDGIPVILLAGVTQPTLSLGIRTDSGRSGRLGGARPRNPGPAQSHIPISPFVEEISGSTLAQRIPQNQNWYPAVGLGNRQQRNATFGTSQ